MVSSINQLSIRTLTGINPVDSTVVWTWFLISTKQKYTIQVKLDCHSVIVITDDIDVIINIPVYDLLNPSDHPT